MGTYCSILIFIEQFLLCYSFAIKCITGLSTVLYALNKNISWYSNVIYQDKNISLQLFKNLNLKCTRST